MSRRGTAIATAAAAILIAAVVVFFAQRREDVAPQKPTAPRRPAKTSLEWHLPAKKADNAKMSHADEVRAEVLAGIEDELKGLVKKKGEIKTFRIGPKPLDPDDPDNALRTATMQEVQMIVGIEPGEPIPPVPFNFMVEDAVREVSPGAATDNGNERFMRELAKWDIEVKEADDETRAAKKRDLIRMQIELLEGIDEGQSVNDTIRAAYEFRKRAYETRRNLISVLCEIQKADPNEEVCRELIKETNAELAQEGIKPIAVSEVLPDAED